MTFRDQIVKVVPPPWRHTHSARILYAIGAHLDVLQQWCIDAVALRFPISPPFDALPLHEADRRIRRGIGEDPVVYAARLATFRQQHWTRGGPYALLNQVHRWTESGTNVTCKLVYRSGRAFYTDAGGNVTMLTIPGWAPDATPEKWATWWLFVYTHEDGAWSQEKIDGLVSICHEWNAAHCIGTLTILPNGAHVWGEPDLDWGDPGLTWGSGTASPITIRSIQ